MNILITYDKNYQDHAKNVINSIHKNNPKATIHAIIKSDVTKKYDGVEYYENDPDMYPCVFKGCNIQSDVVYNYLWAPKLLKCSKVILLGVDSVVDGDLTKLYKHKTSSKGIAAIKLEHKKVGDLKGFVNFFSEGYSGKYKPDAATFGNQSMVMDLKKMKSNNAFDKFMEMVNENKMSEMLAFNLYANGDFEPISPNWTTEANYQKKKQ